MFLKKQLKIKHYFKLKIMIFIYPGYHSQQQDIKRNEDSLICHLSLLVHTLFSTL